MVVYSCIPTDLKEENDSIPIEAEEVFPSTLVDPSPTMITVGVLSTLELEEEVAESESDEGRKAKIIY